MPSGISSSGLFCFTEINSWAIFWLAIGPIWFWNMKLTPVVTTAKTMSDLKVCISEIPAALMAVSSLLSPKLPKVISEESTSGSAWGTNIRPIYQNS